MRSSESMSPKKSLTYGEHQELGARIKEARKLLMDILMRVGNGLGTSAKAAKLASQIWDKFDQDLRGELDSVLFRDCYGDATSEELKAIYFGPTSDSKVVLFRERKD
jgi:hypothetical protein